MTTDKLQTFGPRLNAWTRVQSHPDPVWSLDQDEHDLLVAAAAERFPDWTAPVDTTRKNNITVLRKLQIFQEIV